MQRPFPCFPGLEPQDPAPDQRFPYPLGQPWLLCLVCIVNLYFSRTCYASISIKVQLTDNRAIEGKGYLPNTYPRELGTEPSQRLWLVFLVWVLSEMGIIFYIAQAGLRSHLPASAS